MNHRKSFFLSIIALSLLLSLSFTQSASAQMPSFNMKLSNGKTFSSTQLSKQKPVVIIYFAPDCSHCQTLMNEIFKNFAPFKNAQMVMVTFEPLTELAGFEKKYQTAKYTNIITGTEVPAFFFKNYYQLQHTPFTALFDKKGKLVVSYKDETPVNDLLKRLKMLK